jgi:diguanylate cyclase (GGDEF)-like protein
MGPSGLRSRLWLLVGSLIAAFAAMAVAAHVLQAQGNDALRTVYADRVVPLQQLKAVSDAYAVTVVDSVHKARDGAVSPALAVQRIDDARSIADAQWTEYLTTSMTSDELDLIARATPLLEDADDAARAARDVVSGGGRSEIATYAADQMYPSIDPLSAVLSELVALQEEEAERLFLRAEEAERSVRQTLVIVTALMLTLAVASSIALVRSVTRPLGGVLQMARAVADGALDRTISLPAGAATETVELMVAVEQMRDRLVELADSDELTGLPTRRRLDHLLDRECEGAVRTGRPYVVLVVDLDHFKSVNDSHGHAAGDAVLAAASRTMSDHLRNVDVLARYGGEEFVVLLPGVDMAGARSIADRMRAAMQGDVVVHGSTCISYTASIGLAASDAAAGHARADVLARADRALYEAKRTGRNRVVVDASPASDDRDLSAATPS